MMKHATVLGLMLVAGCATVPVTQTLPAINPDMVTISRNAAPPQCEQIGELQGSGSDYRSLEQDLRHGAATRGANYVSMERQRRDPLNVGWETFARIYNCPAGGQLSAAVATTPTPVSACVPDCSPGYTCVGGQCVSACNPPCASGERCGADRICHHAD